MYDVVCINRSSVFTAYNSCSAKSRPKRVHRMTAAIFMGNRESFLVCAIAVAFTALWSAGPGAESVTDDMLKIACEDMTPRHSGQSPENSRRVPCPYRLLVDATTPVVPGDLVHLTLNSLNGSTAFRGFMIQARDTDGSVLGTFLPDCSSRGGNASHHHMITCSNGNVAFVRPVFF